MYFFFISTDTHTCIDPPFTVEHIFPMLLFMAPKWEALGEALSLDEDLLDEVSTNNENDEACLRVMLEFYMKRSDLKHSWEEIREAMRKVEEKDGGTEELEPTSQRSSMNHQVVAGVAIKSLVVFHKYHIYVTDDGNVCICIVESYSYNIYNHAC